MTYRDRKNSNSTVPAVARRENELIYLTKLGLWVTIIVTLTALSHGLWLATAQAAEPEALPGWVHSEALYPDTLGRHGVILQGSDIGYGSPTIAELDGISQNGKEVVVGGTDGRLYVMRSDGSVLWSTLLPNSECGSASVQKIFSAPAVGDLYGDGVPHLVVGYGGYGPSYKRLCEGGVIAYRGWDGAVSWNFSTKAFAKLKKFWAPTHAVISSPALADTDGDGRLEVGFGALDRNVYLLNANGTVRWYYNAADTVFSSAAFLNVDADSDLEMIIGTDITGNRRIRPATFNGGYLYAFKTKPVAKQLLRFRTPGAYVWQTWFDQVVQSAPVIADVLPGNPGPEIIVGAGCYFPERSMQKNGRWIKIVRPADGAVLQTLLSPVCSSSTVAVGDIDDDGALEIVATVNGAARLGGDGFGRIVAWDPENPLPKWSTIPSSAGFNDSYIGTYQSPIVADLDGNGSLEVIAANSQGVVVLRGSDGVSLSCNSLFCAGLDLFAWDSLKSTPAVDDINLDGKLDLVIGGGNAGLPGRGLLFAWTNFSEVMESPLGLQPPFAAPWPNLRGQVSNIGHSRSTP